MNKEEFDKLPAWVARLAMYRAELQDDSGEEFVMGQEQTQVGPLDANLISSKHKDGTHALLLDLDIDTYYVKSTNNAHLYLDVSLPEEGLQEIVEVLAKWGILQEGIVKQVEDRHATFLRPPGMSKDRRIDNMGYEDYLCYLSLGF